MMCVNWSPYLLLFLLLFDLFFFFIFAVVHYNIHLYAAKFVGEVVFGCPLEVINGTPTYARVYLTTQYNTVENTCGVRIHSNEVTGRLGGQTWTLVPFIPASPPSIHWTRGFRTLFNEYLGKNQNNKLCIDIISMHRYYYICCT